MDTRLFRRDQMWFVEKDRQGNSHLYALAEFSPRKKEQLGRGYLLGRYGAIPFLRDLQNVVLQKGVATPGSREQGFQDREKPLHNY